MDVLRGIRKLYGNNHQITVCMSELDELAVAISKYSRYDDPDDAVAGLSEGVLDEYVDVIIALDHIKNIFRLSDDRIGRKLNAKLDRMERWLKSGNPSPQQTIIDRQVLE